MKIIQGTIPLNYECDYIREDKKLTGIKFSKDENLLATIIPLAIIFSIASLIGHAIESPFLFFTPIIGIVYFIIHYFKKKSDIQKNKIYQYALKDITSVKIIDRAKMMAADKSTLGSLGGAGLGGVMFGGSGSVVGAIASGNKIRKEEDTSLGLGFKDKNWVVIEYTANKTIVGRVDKALLDEILEATSKKQKRPF